MYLRKYFQSVLQMVEQHRMKGQNVYMPSCHSAFAFGEFHQDSLIRTDSFSMWSFQLNAFSRCGSFVGKSWEMGSGFSSNPVAGLLPDMKAYF